MKYTRNMALGLVVLTTIAALAPSCKMNKTRKGAAIGTGGGAVIGAVIGRAAGNTALGALIGATVGGAAGAVIGNKMDKQAAEIEKSIPGAKVYRVGEGIIVEFNDNIMFGFDKSDLNVASKVSLNNLVSILNKYPDTDIEVQGHTDNVGTSSYNMNLSLRRATAVSSYLSIQGISNARTSTKGYGETAPNYSNDTEESRAQNRRVEFLITANKAMQDAAKKETAN
ncbi:MAG: OmpA family protein [Bacteroidia bacterium]|nr:OmpA family protein [Bacteroidia bacterium]